jgi:hypothetical protein
VLVSSSFPSAFPSVLVSSSFPSAFPSEGRIGELLVGGLVLAWEERVGLLVGGLVLAWEERVGVAQMALGVVVVAQMALGVVVAGGFWFPRQP